MQKRVEIIKSTDSENVQIEQLKKMANKIYVSLLVYNVNYKQDVLQAITPLMKELIESVRESYSMIYETIEIN